MKKQKKESTVTVASNTVGAVFSKTLELLSQPDSLGAVFSKTLELLSQPDSLGMSS